MSAIFLRFIKIAVVITALAAISAAPVLASGAGLVFSGTPEYLWSQLDLVQQGRTMPTSVYPLTNEEFYSTVLRDELPASPNLENRLILSLAPQYTAFDTPYTRITTDTVYLYNKVSPTVVIGDEFSLRDLVYINLNIDLSPPERLLYGKNFYKPWLPTHLTELEFPRQSYGVLSIPNASLAAGRFKTGLGNGYFGNTLLNGQAPYYDQIQATYYSEHFKFFYMVATSSTYLTAPEAAIQQNPVSPEHPSDQTHFNEPVKVFAYHHIEYRPVDWAVVGIGEMNLVGGKTPDFAHLNPFGFWHNTYTPGFSNVLFSMDASIVPFKGLQVFGELTFDDIQASMAESPDSKPTTMAWQVGARYVLPFSDKLKHVIGGEFTHADPWMYNRWQPYLIMYQRQLLNGGNNWVDVPLGFTYGGDLNHYGFYYSVVDKNGFRVDASFEHLDKGPIGLGMIDSLGNPIYYNHPDWSGITTGPWGHGVVEQRDTVALSVSYPLPRNLTVFATGQYSWIDNFGHQEGVKDNIAFINFGLRWSY